MSRKLFSYIIFSVLFVLSCSGREGKFTLALHGMEEPGINNVIVKGPDFTTAFHSIPDKIDPVEGLQIHVQSISSEGVVSVIINLSSSNVLQISDVPFKTGKTTYINESEGQLNYVKAHWQ